MDCLSCPAKMCHRRVCDGRMGVGEASPHAPRIDETSTIYLHATAHTVATSVTTRKQEYQHYPHRSARRNRPSRTAPQMALRRAPGAVSRLLWGSSSTSFGSSSDGAHRSAFAGCRCERSTAAPQTGHEHAGHSTQCHVNRATVVTQSTLHRCCCHTRTCTSTSTHVHSKYPRYIPTPRSCEWATCRTQACPSSVARGQSC